MADVENQKSKNKPGPKPRVASPIIEAVASSVPNEKVITVNEEGKQIYGKIPVEVSAAIDQMRGQTTNALLEIGRLEVRKAWLVGRLNQMEAQLQAMLKTEATTLNIPEGTQWELTPEGIALGPLIGG